MSQHESFVSAFHDYLVADPNVRVNVGLLDGLGALPDPSLEAGRAYAEQGQGLLDRLEGLPDAASFEEQLDRDLAQLTLEHEVLKETHRWNGRLLRQQCPRASDALGDPLFLMFLNDPRPAAERLEDMTTRMELGPAYLTALLGALDHPVARWVAMDIEKVGGLPDLFATLRGWAAGEGWAGLARMDAAIAALSTALKEYSAALAALPTVDNVHIGPELAQRFVHTSGIDLTLDELHGIARDFLRETGETLRTLRDTLAPKYGLDGDTSLADLHTWLNKHFAVQVDDMDGVLARYEQERSTILAFIKERDLFPVFDEQDMTILKTPGFMEPSIPAGAMMPPPAFRDGVARSIVYLTLKPELLDEHTELGIPMMMVHEGIPGHHLQLAWASRHPSVVRRHYEGAHHAEGWTTMLEDYMLDQGYAGELEPEVRFGTKRDISRIGARVAIDLYLMTGDPKYLEVGVDFDRTAEAPFGLAGSLLKAVTGFTDGRVQAELNWYSQERAYPLSYLAGNRMVWSLKRDLEAAQAGTMSQDDIDRLFHRTYLEEGNMPVSFLRRVFEHRGLLGAEASTR
ncbi:MAG: DUF885 domain-containing protein [Deltaproteobacteria bacterium]|nr:DUF885 domain-containing protein [Deltaproteobacteria bacterium]